MKWKDEYITYICFAVALIFTFAVVGVSLFTNVA
jgi:lipopolysaccharide export LptBFGC system permease protein LptF